ncbi:MAG: ligase-associated DNA damage response endonuclease PdeM [Rhodothermaceae bacterium TMED105]|nr:MAG: ligase-associated DNA damage response endonuclease PdeM [Rhodothermaceae bacterium TMED105]
MTSNDIKRIIHDQTLWLLPEKAVFWEDEGVLLVADLHFGKVGHFQRQGIAVPRGSQQKTLDRLDRVIHRTEAQAIWFLGDLFHSQPNDEWFEFQEWLANHDTLSCTLIQGNHDIAKPSQYTAIGLDVQPELSHHGLLFAHEPAHHFPKATTAPDDQGSSTDFRLCGHLHPGVKIRSTGRQTLTLPCFFESTDHLMLPAFGEFTGLHCLSVPNDCEAYIVTEERLTPYSSLPPQSTTNYR